MKKKILSLLLALTMVLGLFPTAALAAEGTETVATAADFAAMSNSGSYRLTEDITVTEPYSATFRGSFDGGGHTVTLKVTSSANASVGLFKETGSGAEIKNLTVDADITAAGGGASYGTGGLIGKVVSTTTVADCGVTGSVASTATGSYVAANVGGLVGLVSGDLTLSGSYAACDVSAASPYSSSSVGGLIGRTSNYYTLTVKDCYAAGSVTANKGYAGGLAGYVTCSANYPQSYENCYAAGKVTSAASAGNICGFGYVTATAGYRFANCYFNADENAAGSNKTIDGITGKTGAELKALAPALGDRFQADRAGGWPILDWQYVDPDARYDVTFTVTPADSLLTWNGEAQAPAADGKYRFADAAVGDYSYTVTNEAGDYAPQSGTVTVKNKAVDVSVALALNTHRLTFALTPADADLTLRAGEETLTPGGDGAYAVTNGTYAYAASAFGYEDGAGEVTVDRADVEKTVALAEKPADTVTFAYEAGKDAVTGGVLTVTTADGRTMTPEADGLTYRLPVGYAYTWTFKSANYARQSGALDLTDRTEAMAETVTIPLTAKTAWEGGDDITEPALDGTVYQITSGSELAWFAKQVNQGKGSYQAALANDIDLGGQDWTPIGKSSSYAFKGSFDGQGHTIRGLAINAPSAANQGLFGYVNGGTVKNVTVEGVVTGGTNTAGLVGELAGAGLVENCVNKAAVTGTNAVGGIVGKVSTATAKTVRACANLGAVTGSNQVGGIIGYIYYAVTLEDCYNRGDVAVSSSYGYAGGIAGVMDDSNAKASNCYTTGAVTGSSYAKPAVGQKRSGTAEKLYYLDTLGTDTNGTAKTGAELAALAPELGDAFIAAPAGVNDGYPIFPWQVPSYDAVFTVSPAEAEVAIDGYTGEQSGDTWTFRLPDGTYDYTVSAYGYVTKTGKLTVAGGGVQGTVTLDAAQRKRVSFTVTPAGAAVTVTWNGTVIPPEADGSYSLPYGNYRYAVSAKGYARASGDFAVSGDSPAAYDVALTPSTAWDGTTLTSPAGSGTQAAPYEIGDGEELAWLADSVNAAAGGTVYAVLVNDIDLGGKAWTPIGADGHEFSGSFDGRGHTVSGLAVSGVRYAGLFGAIKDAAVTNVVVKGTAAAEGTGGIAGGIAAVAKVKCTPCQGHF